MSRHWYVYLIIACIFAVSNLLAKRYIPKKIDDVFTLKPPFVLIIMIPIGILVFFLLLGLAIYRGVGDDFWPMIALLSFLLSSVVFFIYFCFMRHICWNEDGISLKNPFSTIFIVWDDVTYAGKGFDGGYVVKSKDATIRYTPQQRGCEALNEEIRHRCQFSKIKF
ncbi:hypothetical protein ACLBWZ_13575 [Brucellaceae bacterium C25G]